MADTPLASEHCESEWSRDGRACTLPLNHDEAHRNGCIWWTDPLTVSSSQFAALSHGRLADVG